MISTKLTIYFRVANIIDRIVGVCRHDWWHATYCFGCDYCMFFNLFDVQNVDPDSVLWFCYDFVTKM